MVSIVAKSPVRSKLAQAIYEAENKISPEYRTHEWDRTKAHMRDIILGTAANYASDLIRSDRRSFALEGAGSGDDSKANCDWLHDVIVASRELEREIPRQIRNALKNESTLDLIRIVLTRLENDPRHDSHSPAETVATTLTNYIADIKKIVDEIKE